MNHRLVHAVRISPEESASEYSSLDGSGEESEIRRVYLMGRKRKGTQARRCHLLGRSTNTDLMQETQDPTPHRLPHMRDALTVDPGNMGLGVLETVDL